MTTTGAEQSPTEQAGEVRQVPQSLSAAVASAEETVRLFAELASSLGPSEQEPTGEMNAAIREAAGRRAPSSGEDGARKAIAQAAAAAEVAVKNGRNAADLLGVEVRAATKEEVPS